MDGHAATLALATVQLMCPPQLACTQQLMPVSELVNLAAVPQGSLLFSKHPETLEYMQHQEAYASRTKLGMTWSLQLLAKTVQVDWEQASGRAAGRREGQG